MAITTPDAVPGEVIEAAWGDAVRADLSSLDSTRVLRGGDTMTGTLTVPNLVSANNVTVTNAVNTKTVAATGTVSAATVTASGTVTGVNVNAGTQSVIGQSPWTANQGGVGLRGDGVAHIQCRGAATLPNLALSRYGTAWATGAPYVGFLAFDNFTLTGSITVGAGGSSVVYNTTSDPRVKTVTGDASTASAFVQALGARAFTGHYNDLETGEPAGDERIMLSSHDVEDVAPALVTGERGATREEDGSPVFQQVDYPGMVPALMAALAQALDRIDALEAAMAT